MTSFATEEYEIFDGAAKVLRTTQSGDVWQFRMCEAPALLRRVAYIRAVKF